MKQFVATFLAIIAAACVLYFAWTIPHDIAATKKIGDEIAQEHVRIEAAFGTSSPSPIPSR